jgi:hypothetical protein
MLKKVAKGIDRIGAATHRSRMRGQVNQQSSMLMLMSPESLVPTTHPIRRVKALADEALRALSPVFDQMYSKVGRGSIPPERLLKASLLMALYSVRSERLFCEQLGYNQDPTGRLFDWGCLQPASHGSPASGGRLTSQEGGADMPRRHGDRHPAEESEASGPLRRPRGQTSRPRAPQPAW